MVLMFSILSVLCLGLLVPPVSCSGSYRKQITCKCSCCPRVSKINISSVNVEEVVENITAELAVEKNGLSATTRKFSGSHDDRPSSQFIGTSAILFITIICVAISGPDVATVLYHLNRKYKCTKRLRLELERRGVMKKLKRINCNCVERGKRFKVIAMTFLKLDQKSKTAIDPTKPSTKSQNRAANIP